MNARKSSCGCNRSAENVSGQRFGSGLMYGISLMYGLGLRIGSGLMYGLGLRFGLSLKIGLGLMIVSASTIHGIPEANGRNISGAVDNATKFESISSERPPSQDFLAIARNYADAMIAHGRDRYGDVHTPMFAAALSRETMQLGSRDEFGSIQGIREIDRSLGGANPWDHLALYPLLFHLADFTGDPSYAEKATSALEYFFQNTQSPETGLMAWGDHIYWDFHTNSMGGYRYHEIAGAWPFWDLVYELAPEAAWRFALGLWNHQVADQETGNFSRHALYSEHGPEKSRDFPRYAGQMILIWADAWSRPENAEKDERDEMIRAIRTLVSRMERNMKLGAAGYLVAHEEADYVWPFSNLELARSVWEAIPLVRDADVGLAEQMKTLALRQDKDYLRAPHRILDGGGFATTLHSETGEARVRSMNQPYSSTWSTGYGHGIHAEYGNRLLGRYRQLVDAYPEMAEQYRLFGLTAADKYLTEEPDPDEFVTPRIFTNIIVLLLEAWHLTGNHAYLERADFYGSTAVSFFMEDDNPLPKASNHHHHYEAKTGGADLMFALFALHRTITAGEHVQLFWDRKRGW